MDQSKVKQLGSWALALALGAVAAVAVHWQRAGTNSAAIVSPGALQPTSRESVAAAKHAGGDLSLGLAAALQRQSVLLEAMRDEMQGLGERVDQLERQTAAIDAATPTSPSDAPPSGRVATPTVANLTALGEDSATAEQVLGRIDELALQRLNLRHQAQLDGADRERIREELRALPNDRQALRDEFGDASYDRYLYASGRPNRLSVTSVLQGSAAADAGLQAGDVIQSIDGSSIFTLGDLQRVVRGTGSGSVSIEVSRGTERIESSVIRGPLGVRTLGTSVDPSGP